MDKLIQISLIICGKGKLYNIDKEFASTAAKFFINDFLPSMEKYNHTIQEVKMYREDIPEALQEISLLIFFNIISTKQAREILDFVWKFPYYCVLDIIVKEKILEEKSENELGLLVDKLVQNNPKVVKQIQNGKTKAYGFFVGQIMKETKGKADPQLIQSLLENKIKEL